MRFVKFRSLEIKNFLSFGSKNIKAEFQDGVNAIIGVNLDKEDSKNGAGKSAITEALYYCLYGTTLREISKDFIQNSITKERPVVSLWFDLTINNQTHSYKIVRKLNPTKCELYKDGDLITLSTLAKTNDFIQNLIRTPSSVFKNSVIMSANNALPFMALSKVDKRKFIESILGLEVFTAMVLKVRDDYNNIKKDYEIAYNSFEQTQKEFQFNKSQFSSYEEDKKKKIEELEEKKKIHDKDLCILHKKQQDLTSLLKSSISINELEEWITKFEGKKNSLSKNNKTVLLAIQDIETKKTIAFKTLNKLVEATEFCPTCNQKYTTEHVDHVKKLVASSKKEIETLEVILLEEKDKKGVIEKENVEVEGRIKSLYITKETLIKNTTELEKLTLSIDFLQRNIKEVLVEMQVCQQKHNNELKNKLLVLGKELEENKERVEMLNNKLNILDSVKFVVSEEGIKSFIVKRILSVLNGRLAFYLQRLQANSLCQFNEFFDETIIDEKSESKSYFNFSGGERKRIDLACLFAFADIRRLQGDVNFSTIFYDELLDSSLDDKGVLLTLNVLRERFNESKESCYVITHRGPEVVSRAEHTIKVVKQNGISSIQR